MNHGPSTPFYVGTYAGGIYRCRLPEPPILAAETPAPAFLAMHSRQPFLYAVNERTEGSVGAWEIMPEEAARRIPQITRIKPNGPDRIERFEAAGGTRAVLARLKDRLDLDAMTVTGQRLSTILAEEFPIDGVVIRPLERPFRQEPGLAILRGNLAPGGAIVKLSAVPEALRRFSGPARIFEDEDAAIRELAQSGIRPGDVVVLRMMGPADGPGTVFACSFMAALTGASLSESVAVVTDGELSGLNRGITVGRVMPEAARGGPLAAVREGETIRIELEARSIDFDVAESELRRRLDAWRPAQRHLKPGWLAIYAEVVQPIENGVVLGQRE